MSKDDAEALAIEIEEYTDSCYEYIKKDGKTFIGLYGIVGDALDNSAKQGFNAGILVCVKELKGFIGCGNPIKDTNELEPVVTNILRKHLKV